MLTDSNFLVVQVLPTMTASINAYTFLLFAIANMIFLPFIYFFYPETTGEWSMFTKSTIRNTDFSGRTLEELDVVFAHAHLTKRRPTLIAAELPKLTDYQIQTMTDKYGIHDGAEGTEDAGSYGAPVNAGEADTTLPPAHPDGFREGNKNVRDSNEHSSNSTRVPTPTGGPTLTEKTGQQ